MRRSFAVLASTGLLLFASLALATGAIAARIAPTTTCSNGVPDTAGLGLICEVTVVNTITGSGGTALVTVRECHGAAGDPTAACTTITRTLQSPVTLVRQCNNALNGGGATVRCSVRVTNNFVGVGSGGSAVTVNQCVGSGDGIANNCDPFPATTTGAVVTQCNGSANGGTLVNLECTATGRTSSALRVAIDQCNGSANGGGALVICSSRIINNVLGGATATPGSGGGPTPPATDTPVSTGSSGSGGAIASIAIFLLALIVLATHRSVRTSRRR